MFDASYRIPATAYTLFLFLGSLLLLIFEKGEIFLWINQHHHPVLDQFFKYITYLGDGILFPLLIIIFLFVRLAYTLIVVGITILQTFFVKLFKWWLLPDLVRPRKFFEGMDLHIVEGVDVHSFHTFPSGHTATAFAIATLLVILFNTKNGSLVLFVLAILAGVSRVYLSQHFFIDIYVGSVLGVLSTLLTYLAYQKIDPQHSNAVLNKPLIRVG